MESEDEEDVAEKWQALPLRLHCLPSVSGNGYVKVGDAAQGVFCYKKQDRRVKSTVFHHVTGPRVLAASNFLPRSQVNRCDPTRGYSGNKSNEVLYLIAVVCTLVEAAKNDVRCQSVMHHRYCCILYTGGERNNLIASHMCCTAQPACGR